MLVNAERKVVMANGGPTPACLHCKWFIMDSRHCTKHDIRIGVSVPRVFCNDLHIEGEADWVKQKVDLRFLMPDLLYIWLEVDYIDPQGSPGHTFSLFPFSYIRHYKAWSEDEEGEMLGELS